MSRTAIIGLGLIGGSLARALKVAEPDHHITGFDPDARQGRMGLELGVIDAAADSAEIAVREADRIIVAVPVLHTAEALKSIRSALQTGAVITDVGSTKQSVLRDVESCFGELPANFVAAHPIAGTEKSGIAASKEGLFRDRRVVLTPHANQSASALAHIRAMWESLGCRVVEMDAARHDAIFAATSHLPHVLAYAFVDMLTRLDAADEIFPNAGGGFRDFTRIASSSPEMWHDIIRANGSEVTRLLEKQIGELQEMLDLMKQGQWDSLKARFDRARTAREKHLGQIE